MTEQEKIEDLQQQVRELKDELWEAETERDQLEDELDDLRDEVAKLEKSSLETVVANQKHRLMLGLDADLTLAEFLDRLETT